jgi:hypothetical protein
MNDLPGYAAAQREYENREPESGPSECATCQGKGAVDETLGGEHFSNPEAECPDCGGFGLLTADGEPFDPHKAENDAADYADMKRDERLTQDNGDAPIYDEF